MRVLVWTPKGWRKPGVTRAYRSDPASGRLLAEVQHDDDTRAWYFVENLTRPERYRVNGE